MTNAYITAKAEYINMYTAIVISLTQSALVSGKVCAVLYDDQFSSRKLLDTKRTGKVGHLEDPVSGIMAEYIELGGTRSLGRTELEILLILSGDVEWAC
jgi:hypothetical protein